MLTETELSRLIVSWKNQEGEDIKGRRCVPIEGRLEMYKTLVKTLVELHGYSQEDLEGKTYRMVMEASISPNSDKKEGWRKAATTDWNNAVDFFFPQKILRHDSSAEPVREKREKFVKKEYDTVDPRLAKDNPIDLSVFEGLPPVDNSVDEDFLKEMASVGNKDE